MWYAATLHYSLLYYKIMMNISKHFTLSKMCTGNSSFFMAAPTLDVLVSPKDTRIKEHGTVDLICSFRSSTKIKVWWEKQDGLIPDDLRSHISTTQYKSENYFVVSISHILHFTYFINGHLHLDL